MQEGESLSLGFADSLISLLGTLPGFVVPPTSSILKYSGGTDPAIVSRDLQVRYVLQGNIQKLGPRWRVSIQLVEAESRKIIVSDRYDLTLDDIFDVQDEIGRRVAGSLEARLQTAEFRARDRYSNDRSAYDEYLKGLGLSFSDEVETMDRATEHLSNAVERDPDFALAHAALTRVLMDKYKIYDGRGILAEKAEFHCRRALELDPSLPESHIARGCVLWSQAKNYAHREAIAEFEKSLALHPNVDLAHGQLGLIFSHAGRMKEGLAAFEKAHRVNPQNAWAHWAGLAHLWSGEYEAADRGCDQWLKESPGSKYALWLRPQPQLLMGDLKAAESTLRQTLAQYPDEPLFTSLQGMLRALQGEGKTLLDTPGKPVSPRDRLGTRITRRIRWHAFTRFLVSRNRLWPGWTGPSVLAFGVGPCSAQTRASPICGRNQSSKRTSQRSKRSRGIFRFCISDRQWRALTGQCRSPRKFATSFFPASVNTLSGWNWTPSTG